MPDFTNKTILVTGAGSGIGAATVNRLYADGANVVLLGRTKDKLIGASADKAQDRVMTVTADVAEEGQIRSAVGSAVKRFGGLDGLVVNAGVAAFGSVPDMTARTFRDVISTNLTGAFLTIQAAWDALSEAKGSIVATSSVSGLGGDWGGFAYNASKGGLSNLVRAMALDFKTSGIRVNAVAPSLTDTEMAPDKDAPVRDKFAERIPMGRAAEPAEVADVIAFLLGSDARFVNGVVLPVDGGLSASNGQPPLS